MSTTTTETEVEQTEGKTSDLLDDTTEEIPNPGDSEKGPDLDLSDDEPDTFPREYVEKLRKEAADARVRAKDRDDLAARLHTALVAATGRLADPSDLAYDDAHLDDEDALNAALDDLLSRKPHLASRRPRGDVGQGVGGSNTSVDLAGLLRSRA